VLGWAHDPAGLLRAPGLSAVPLVWQHGHASPENVLGHAVLENRDEGVYAYGYFNQTAQGQNAKALVEHGDISALSIFANGLIEKAKQVSHGIIRELSLVLAGANPGALIDNIAVAHADGEVDIHVDEAIIYTGLELEHADAPGSTTDEPAPAAAHAATTETGTEDPSIEEVYASMDEDQKAVVHYMVGAALESAATSTDNTDTQTDTSASEEVVTHEKRTRTR
jgi:hypothetical protein